VLLLAATPGRWHRGEVGPSQAGAGDTREPQADPATAAAQVDEVIAWPEPQLREDAIEALARDEREWLHARGKRAEHPVEQLIRLRSLRNPGEHLIKDFRGERIVIRHGPPPFSRDGGPRYTRQEIRASYVRGPHASPARVVRRVERDKPAQHGFLAHTQAASLAFRLSPGPPWQMLAHAATRSYRRGAWVVRSGGGLGRASGSAGEVDADVQGQVLGQEVLELAAFDDS